MRAGLDYSYAEQQQQHRGYGAKIGAADTFEDEAPLLEGVTAAWCARPTMEATAAGKGDDPGLADHTDKTAVQLRHRGFNATFSAAETVRYEAPLRGELAFTGFKVCTWRRHLTVQLQRATVFSSHMAELCMTSQACQQGAQDSRSQWQQLCLQSFPMISHLP